MNSIKAAALRSVLFAAFGVENSKQLKKHLKKTDLRSKAELLHAIAVVWSYSQRYQLKSYSVLGTAMARFPRSLSHKLAYEAKQGYGSYPC